MIKSKKIYRYIIVFLICFVPRCYFALKAIPLRTLSDELSTLNGAALAAGYDWSNVVSNAGYYGFGMTSLLGFIFKLFRNPITIYRAFMVCFAVFQSIPGIIAYYILKNQFPDKNHILLIIISSILSYSVVARANICYNEHGLILISWLITLLIYNMFCFHDQKKKLIINSVCFVFLLGYSQTVHTRATIFLIAGAICTIIYALSHKKSLLKAAIMVIATVVVVFLAKSLVSYYQSNVWAGEGIRNTQITLNISESIGILRLKAIVLVLFGQLNTFTLVTCGGIIISIICAIHMLANGIRMRQMKVILDTGYVYIALFFMLCFFGTMLAQAISWSTGVAANMASYGVEQVYSLKALTYVRYAGPYLGPILLFGFIYLMKIEGKSRGMLIAGIIIVFIMQKYWRKYIVPYCVKTPDGSEPYICFSRSLPWTHTAQIFNASMIVLLFIALAIVVLCWYHRNIFAMSLLLVYMLYQYGYNAINYDLYMQKIFSDEFVDVYDYINDNDILSGIDAKSLYAVDYSENKDHQFYYLAQFYFYDYNISTTLPQSYNDNFVIITNTSENILNEIKDGMHYEEWTVNNYKIIVYSAD